MLKTFYDNETEIPENLKGAYESKNGRHELRDLEKEHPVLLKNKELLGKNSTLTTENQRLNSDVTGLESKSLPDGKVAVDPEIERLGNAAKAANLKPADIGTLKTQAETLKASFAEREKADKQGLIADAMGWKRSEFSKYVKDLEIAETEEEKDGQKVKSFFVVSKDSEGKETRTKLEEHADVKPLIPILAMSQEEKKAGFNFSEQGGKQTPSDPFQKIREEVKAQSESNSKVLDLEARFGRPN